MTQWTKDGQPFTQDDVPEDAVGFVYVITNKLTGKKYIGKKGFWRTITRPPLKGKTRKRKTIVPSDWPIYCSSSEEVKRQIATHGLESFDREILEIAYSKGMLSYLELKQQVLKEVLFDENYLNGIIQCRINRKHLKRGPNEDVA